MANETPDPNLSHRDKAIIGFLSLGWIPALIGGGDLIISGQHWHSWTLTGGGVAAYVLSHVWPVWSRKEGAAPLRDLRDATPVSDQKDPQDGPTLLKLFEADFPGLGAHFEDTHLDDQQGFTADFKTKLYTDHNAGSKFLTFYMAESPDAYRIVEILADLCEQIIDRIQSGVVVRTHMAGQIATATGKELRFTGFIYIYSPQDFSLQQLAALDSLYGAKGLKLIVRGRAYESAKFLAWYGASG